MTAHCPKTGDLCGRLDCDPDDHECAMQGGTHKTLWVDTPPVRVATAFAIQGEDGLYVRSDIDSGGMTVCLASRVYADRFDDIASAESFKGRVAARYPTALLKVVPC